jgi:hypothetical protein
MNLMMRSLNIGKTPEAKRRLSEIELGDTVAVKKLVHRWVDTSVPEEGKPHIAKGSANIEASKGQLFSFIFIGRHLEGEPLTESEIEARMNTLGWFRKDS